MDLYFECYNGISGDMAVAALIDLGASLEKLEKALISMGLNDEFNYVISKKSVNAIMATDFDVILKEHQMHHSEHHHEHRNLNDINLIIDKANTTDNAKNLAKKIFKIVAEAESKVHGKDINAVHFHEIGAIDSIVDIVSFAVLLDDLSPDKVYFSTLTDGQGSVECQHGIIPVPVPAVCEIVSKYKLPFRISDNNGEMVTPTGAAIVASLYNGANLPMEFIINNTGYGAGKRPYKNPILRAFCISYNQPCCNNHNDECHVKL